jgi:hypothetical protein
MLNAAPESTAFYLHLNNRLIQQSHRNHHHLDIGFPVANLDEVNLWNTFRLPAQQTK